MYIEDQKFEINDEVSIITVSKEMETKFVKGDKFIIAEVMYKKGFVFYKIKENIDSKMDYIVSQDDIKYPKSK